MNCTTCRYELSQCLDGRLPSGRRTIVLQHVDGCAACKSFWAELQAAQQLVLQLPKHGVGDGFREQLWERIRAGEGTPDAVFHEPVPMLTKARYLLTGAAAAAAVLIAFSWWQKADNRPAGSNTPIAQTPTPRPTEDAHAVRDDRRGTGLVPRTSNPDAYLASAAPPMLASAQRLTADLVAVEAARQFEQRYTSANRDLARLAQDSSPTNERVVDGLLDKATELHSFADVLLDLRDVNRVSFDDAEIGADLRVVANLLGQSRLQKRNLETVRAFVAPALQQSVRLGSLASRLRVRPSFGPLEERAEQEMLRRLSTQRPEVFPKLFFVFPSEESCPSFEQLARGDVFLLEDQCGPSFVAPRSRVEEDSQRVELMIRSSRQRNGEMQVDVYVNGQKKND